MAKLRLNNYHRSFLRTLARRNISCPKSYRRMCAARNAAAALIENWDGLPRITRVHAIANIIEMLKGAQHHAIKGSE